MDALKATPWHEIPERGSALAIRLLLSLTRLLGRSGTSLLLVPIAWWYVLFAPSVRRASRDYLRRLGMEGSLPEVAAHVRCFAQVALDRYFWLSGDTKEFAVTTNGEEHLLRLQSEGQGAILLLAHVGSFEALRGMGWERDLKIHAPGYFGNARRINAALTGLKRKVEANVIAIRQGDPTIGFEVEDRIRAGEIVGIMVDRVSLGGRPVAAPFLGSQAQLASSPFLLAAALECPIYLSYGLFTPPNRYDLHCELFAERVDIPRANRQQAVASYVGAYAARLEQICRSAPNNWFNFFDFWSSA